MSTKGIKSITVKAIDNELIVSAYSWATSIELGHLKAGNYNAAGLEMTVNGILPAGTWTLLVVGINWGGPTKFDITINYTDGTKMVLPVTPPAGTTGTVQKDPPVPQGGIVLNYQEVFKA